MLARIGLLVSSALTNPVVPTIASFSLSPSSKAPGCAPVSSDGTWTISNPDNTNYKLVVLENGDEFACASASNTPLATPDNYVDGSNFSVTPTFTLQVVRRADSVVMSSQSATSPTSIPVDGFC